MFGISAYAQTPFASTSTGAVKTQLLTILSTSTTTLNKSIQKLLSIVSTSTVAVLTNKTIYVLLIVVNYISLGVLNNYVLNNNAINDNSSNGVTNTSTLTNSIKKTIVYVSSTISSLASNFAFLILLSVVATSTSIILKAIQTIKTVTANNTNSVIKTVNKTISYVNTSVNSLTPSRAFLKLLSVASTSTATLVLLTGKTLAVVSTSATTKILNIGKKVSASISSSVVLLYGFFFNSVLTASVSTTNTMVRLLTFGRTIAATVASTVAIQKLRAKIVFVVATTTVLVATITARFVLLVTTVYTSVVSHFYKVLTNIEDTIIVPTKKVIVQVFAGFIDILVKPKKTNIVVTKQDDVNG